MNGYMAEPLLNSDSKKMVSLVLATLAAVASGDRSEAADNWTGWLGPQRNGWVADFVPPTPWPEALHKQWSVEVGTGYGSPLVVADRVYQHARQGDQEVVWCLDRSTGGPVWKQSLVVPFKTAAGGEYHGNSPKSSPVYADGRLFTMSIHGTLSAWDGTSGDLLWQRSGDAEFGQSHPNWGAATSPIVDGDHVVVHFGTDEAGALLALRVATGEIVWKQGQDGPSYSSPLVGEIEGVRQIIEWNHRALVGVDRRTGTALWEFPFPHVGSDQNMPTPTLHQGRVLIGGENRGIHSVRPMLQDGAWTVAHEWHQKDIALDMSSAVMNGEHLYGFSHYDRGRLFCLDPTSGKVLWTGPPRTGQNVMFLSAPGFVAALINDGELRILKASPLQYEPLATYRVAADRTWAPPVLFSDGLLIKDQQHLTLWSIPGQGP